MAIPTSRAKEPAIIKIDTHKCIGCGQCVSVCKDFSLIINDSKAEINNNPLFGCIGCGHCMAICPSDAIEINGREISPQEVVNIANTKNKTNFEELYNLLLHRRSIREFISKDIEPYIIEKILEASVTAPMGIPPTDVNVLIINRQEKVIAFTKDFSNYLRKYKFLTSKWTLSLLKPFINKETYELFKCFFAPLFKAYTFEMDKGNNYITYNAPLLMYFYGTPYSDPADPIIAATYAMITAETLGLGTCMLGAIHPLIQNGKEAKSFREKHKIICKSKEGIFIAFGYPKVKYEKTIKRTFASINYL